jgi:hypothetical protein
MSDWDSFRSLETYLWHRLSVAVGNAADPWRYPALATIGALGPQARVVGLRGADQDLARVEVHTDSRTPKVTELQDDPRAQLLFWHPDHQEQLRLSVRFDVREGEEEKWARIPEEAQGNYGTTPAPGRPISGPDDYCREPSIDRFTVLSGEVISIDAVNLRTTPHRRAQWFNGTWAWVAP